MVVILCVFYSFILSKQFFSETLEQAVTSEQCHYHMDGGSRTCGAHVSGQAALESITIEHRTGTSSSHWGLLSVTAKQCPGTNITWVRPLIRASTLFIPKKNVLQTGAQGIILH